MTTEMLELDVYNSNLRYMDEDARRGAETDEALRQRTEARQEVPLGRHFQMVFQSLLVWLTTLGR